MSRRLLNAIREISASSAEAMKPADIFFGEVERINPLVIGVDQKLKLTEEVLVLTGAVLDHVSQLSNEGAARQAYVSDLNDISGSCRIRLLPQYENFTFKNSLMPGEKVILLRASGGQKYVVLDRVVNL